MGFCLTRRVLYLDLNTGVRIRRTHVDARDETPNLMRKTEEALCRLHIPGDDTPTNNRKTRLGLGVVVGTYTIYGCASILEG